MNPIVELILQILAVALFVIVVIGFAIGIIATLYDYIKYIKED